MTSGIQAWIEIVIGRAGYMGLAVLMLVETLVPPIPSELILPLSGFLVGLGRLQLAGVLAASTAGSLLGAVLLYAAGRSIGETRLRRLLRRWGGRLGFAIGAFDRSAVLLRRHSAPVLFWGRFVPGLRSVLSLPAGIVGIPLPAFLFWTGLSALCWNAILIGAGWWLGAQWHHVAVVIDRYGAWLLVVAAVAVAVGWTRWVLSAKRGRASRGGRRTVAPHHPDVDR